MTTRYIVTKDFDPMEQSDRDKLPVFFADIANHVDANKRQIIAAATTEGAYRFNTFYLEESDEAGNPIHQFYPYESVSVDPDQDDFASINSQILLIKDRLDVDYVSQEFEFYREAHEQSVADDQWPDIASGREFAANVYKYIGMNAWLTGLLYSDIGQYLETNYKGEYQYGFDAFNNRVMIVVKDAKLAMYLKLTYG